MAPFERIVRVDQPGLLPYLGAGSDVRNGTLITPVFSSCVHQHAPVLCESAAKRAFGQVYNLKVLSDRGDSNSDQPPGGRSPDGVSTVAVRNHLEKILSSKAFVPSPQLCRFLRFVVEQEAGGQGGQLKEYLLGVEVFHRDQSFDPRIDTVVRTEARRLRQKLTEYYQDEGLSDAVKIELPKGGYCPIFHLLAAPPVAAVLPPPVPAGRKGVIAVVATLAIAVIVGYWLWARSRDAGPVSSRPSIAVLPLENLSADPEQEYFSDGMTDALITDLAKIGGLIVKSRTSTLQFKKTRKPMAEIGQLLGVEYLVEGTILRAGDRVRITAQLIAVPKERHVWAESYQRTGDILALQSEIAREIAGQVNVRLTPQEQARLIPRPVSPEAHDLYLKGRFSWHTRDPDRLRQSVEYFNQAIGKEPRYALAYAGLADSYSVLMGRSNGSSRQDLEARSCEAARKAIELDDSLGEAHASLGACADAWDWQNQEREFRRALELSPGYPTAHSWYGQLLTNTGRAEQGLTETRRFAELDPASVSANGALGWALYMARQYDQAIRQLQQTIEAFPEHTQSYSNLGMAYSAKGMHREAIDVLERAVKLAGGAPPVAALLAHAQARAGDRKPAERLLDEFKKHQGVTPIAMALVYMDLGDRDHAFEWFGKGVEQRSMYIRELKTEPMFDSLHADPRFTTLLKKMNLPN